MEENAQVHEHHMEEIEAKKKADIEKMEKRKEKDISLYRLPIMIYGVWLVENVQI